jgi:hypothetical protein
MYIILSITFFILLEISENCWRHENVHTNEKGFKILEKRKITSKREIIAKNTTAKNTTLKREISTEGSEL